MHPKKAVSASLEEDKSGSGALSEAFDPAQPPCEIP